jgi:hypothetical protein
MTLGWREQADLGRQGLAALGQLCLAGLRVISLSAQYVKENGVEWKSYSAPAPMSSPALLRSSPCASPKMSNAFLACRFAAAVSDMVADSFLLAVGSSVEKSAAMSSSGTAVARSVGSPAVARAGGHSSVVSKLLRADSESSSNHDDDEDEYSDWDDESEDEIDAQHSAWDAIPEELQVRWNLTN